MIWDVFPGMDLCCTGPAQQVVTAGEDLSTVGDPDHLSVRRVKRVRMKTRPEYAAHDFLQCEQLQ